MVPPLERRALDIDVGHDRVEPAGMICESEKMKPPNTDTMMSAAATTTARPARNPRATARRADAPCTSASRMPDPTGLWMAVFYDLPPRDGALLVGSRTGSPTAFRSIRPA